MDPENEDRRELLAAAERNLGLPFENLRAGSNPPAAGGRGSTRARMLFHAGDEAGARRDLDAWAGAIAGVPLVGNRSTPLAAPGEA